MIAIGPRRSGNGTADRSDPAAALLECHERIRQMAALGRALAGADAGRADEIRDAATRVGRYFAEALPYHVEDEEESLLPRLRGREPELDAALDRMRAEHVQHEALLSRLLAACGELAEQPERLTAVRAELDTVSAQLATEFAAHLDSEERIVFPAMRRLLTDDERAEIRAEMRLRRSPQESL
jgi:iron-sulfur cluster repair protein YtfE (RIC family)